MEGVFRCGNLTLVLKKREPLQPLEPQSLLQHISVLWPMGGRLGLGGCREGWWCLPAEQVMLWERCWLVLKVPVILGVGLICMNLMLVFLWGDE